MRKRDGRLPLHFFEFPGPWPTRVSSPEPFFFIVRRDRTRLKFRIMRMMRIRSVSNRVDKFDSLISCPPRPLGHAPGAGSAWQQMF